jgi:hypothetical protein
MLHLTIEKKAKFYRFPVVALPIYEIEGQVGCLVDRAVITILLTILDK